MTHSLHTKYTWMDGKLLRSEDANVPLLTHSLHYGSAIFEGERFYMTKSGPAAFRLTDHTNRLFHSAKVMGMEILFTKAQIVDAIKKLIVKNKIEEGYIRPIVFYGTKMGLAPNRCPTHVAIAMWPWNSYLGGKTIKVKTSAVRRLDARTIDPTAKISGYYANSILAIMEAERAGFNEAILLDTNGYVAEGPGENIFSVKNNILITPSLGSILPGITRSSIITIARDKKIKVLEKKVALKELKSADEVFFTGTATEITPIGRIDNTKIGDGAAGPITTMLKTYYMSIVHGEIPKYHRWLTWAHNKNW